MGLLGLQTLHTKDKDPLLFTGTIISLFDGFKKRLVEFYFKGGGSNSILTCLLVLGLRLLIENYTNFLEPFP